MITLKTLRQASGQEVFDQVAKHLLTQMKQSSMDGPDGYHCCLYRQGDLKCAAGCLIADDEYLEKFEGRAWHRIVDMGYTTRKHKDLIGDLQRLHDSSEPEFWAANLRFLAKEYGLKWRF